MLPGLSIRNQVLYNVVSAEVRPGSPNLPLLNLNMGLGSCLFSPHDMHAVTGIRCYPGETGIFSAWSRAHGFQGRPTGQAEFAVVNGIARLPGHVNLVEVVFFQVQTPTRFTWPG